MNPQWRKINKRSGNIKRAWKIVSTILNITIYVKKINLKQANTKRIKRYER